MLAFQLTMASTGFTTGCEKVIVFVPPSSSAIISRGGGAFGTSGLVKIPGGPMSFVSLPVCTKR
jgi:hypothetical protein